MPSNLIQEGAEWLATVHQEHVANEVSYVHSGGSATVPATIDSTEYEIDDGTGVVVRVESRDFIVPASLLPSEPRRGDRIRETSGSTVYVFEVTGYGGQPHWKWADAFRYAYRVHTRQIDTEDVP